jgi:hypothetical protein
MEDPLEKTLISGGRSDKSLTQLTKKFVEILKHDMTIDLNAVKFYH